MKRCIAVACSRMEQCVSGISRGGSLLESRGNTRLADARSHPAGQDSHRRQLTHCKVDCYRYLLNDCSQVLIFLLCVFDCQSRNVSLRLKQTGSQQFKLIKQYL
jgi:hypothetical protein